MNTDNMSISRETIDYGPCAFMDTYDPNTVFSSIDHHGHYAYGNQGSIAQWNLACFPKTLLPLIHKETSVSISLEQEALESFAAVYSQDYQTGMKYKLGLKGDHEQDLALVTELLNIMQANAADYTHTFVQLTYKEKNRHTLYTYEAYKQWLKKWHLRRAENAVLNPTVSESQLIELQKQANPLIIPRNHYVKAVLKSAAEDRNMASFHYIEIP